MEDGKARISVKGLWKVFGPDPERCMRPEWVEKTRGEIQEETDCVVALKNVSFDVAGRADGHRHDSGGLWGG